MDSLAKLTYFSIGNNEITQETSILSYLPRFKNLQVLIVQGNSFIINDTESDMKFKIIAHLPQLKYFDYMMIDEVTLKRVQEKHASELKQAEEKLQGKAEMTQESIMKEKEEANIAKLDKFAEQLKDPDFKKLEYVPKQNELWTKFEDELKEELSSYEDNMKKLAQQRKETMEVCENLLREEEKEVEAKVIQCINEFKHTKKHMIRDFTKGLVQISAADNLKKQLKGLESEIMRIEMDHFELASNQITQKFSTTIETIISQMSNFTNTFKDKINTANKKYHTGLRQFCNEKFEDFYNTIIEEATQKNWPNKDDIASTYGEKETLLTSADNSSGAQNQKIEETVNFILKFLYSAIPFKLY